MLAVRDNQNNVYLFSDVLSAVAFIDYWRDEGVTMVMCTVLDRRQAFRDCAHLADRCAEIEAEEAREFSAKDQAEQQISDAREQIHETNRLALALIKEIKDKQYAVPVCEALKHRLEEFLADRRQCFARIDKLTDNFWAACPDY